MADVRIGGLYADITARNARFVRATQQNARALRRQQRRVGIIGQTADRVRRWLVETSQRLGVTVEQLQLLRRSFEAE